MSSANLVTLAIIGTLIAIFISLGYGLFNLLTSQESNYKLAKALSYRISLSLLLFIALVVAILQGWVTPNPPQL
jgi:hypothetical protein